MKAFVSALCLTCILGTVPALAWGIGSVPENNDTQNERKIVRVFHQIQNGSESFAAFQLSNNGGTGISNQAIIVHNLTSASTKAVYNRLLAAFEKGQIIIHAFNESRLHDTGYWFGITTFYRVYSGDHFYSWIR